jgi:AraC family transcriptional regulator, regulatory protein of adaptative response / DNA-3-methyladenine glycosylase II
VTEAIEARLPFQVPLERDDLFGFFARRALPGVEEVQDQTYRRSLRLRHGAGVVELTPTARHVHARFWLDDEADFPEAIRRSRSMLDLDCDPRPVRAVLDRDDLIGPLVRAAPGLRVPGTPDPHELAIRAVIGQQISVAGAATLAGRLVADYGEPLTRPAGAVTHLFPSASALVNAQPDRLAMPGARRRALRSLAAALASGELELRDGADPDGVRRQLLALPGIGAWTAEYIAMRALRDADAFLPGDLGIRRALTRLGQDGSPAAAARLAERWRPYRAYAFQYLLAATIPA